MLNLNSSQKWAEILNSVLHLLKDFTMWFKNITELVVISQNSYATDYSDSYTDVQHRVTMRSVAHNKTEKLFS